jgi:hypothetical protein
MSFSNLSKSIIFILLLSQHNNAPASLVFFLVQSSMVKGKKVKGKKREYYRQEPW